MADQGSKVETATLGTTLAPPSDRTALRVRTDDAACLSDLHDHVDAIEAPACASGPNNISVQSNVELADMAKADVRGTGNTVGVATA